MSKSYFLFYMIVKRSLIKGAISRIQKVAVLIDYERINENQ
jgi:hypothetical protein